MCTVSWTAGADGYDLFFNRDELNARAAESPPELMWRDGLACAAPRDGARGGTWLAANASGLTVCLLNDYGAAWQPACGDPAASRGHLVAACAGAATHAEVMTLMQAQPLRQTRPFHLVAISPEEGPLVLHWQGLGLVRRHPAAIVPPLTSSSFATAAVVAARIRCFATMVGDGHVATPGGLASYHRQHDCAAGAYSVLMRRTDAATRSILHVSVTRDRVKLDYEPMHWGPGGQVLQPITRVEFPRTRARAVLAA